MTMRFQVEVIRTSSLFYGVLFRSVWSGTRELETNVLYNVAIIVMRVGWVIGRIILMMHGQEVGEHLIMKYGLELGLVCWRY